MPSIDFTYIQFFSSVFLQVHLCGHATLATAHVLFTEVGMTAPQLIFSTLSGDLIVERIPTSEPSNSPLLRMNFPQGKPMLTILPDELLDAVLRGLGLARHDLVWREGQNHQNTDAQQSSSSKIPMTAICPVTKKLFIEITSADKLLELKPNAELLLGIPFEAAELPVRGVSVMVHGGSTDRSSRQNLNIEFYIDTSTYLNYAPYDFLTRYFAPWNGIYEDPVNGSSHAALVVYWSKQVSTAGMGSLPLIHVSFQLGKERLRAFQASARTGELEVELAPNDRMYIYGHAITVMGGRLRT